MQAAVEVGFVVQAVVLETTGWPDGMPPAAKAYEVVEVAAVVLLAKVVELEKIPVLFAVVLTPPVPVVKGAVVSGIVTDEEVVVFPKTDDVVELAETIEEEDTPVLRGTDADPVPVGPAVALVLVPLPYGELSVLEEET